jgi:hypothetical protein
MFAKIKDNIIVTYPYDFSNLQSENPYTNFGSNPNILEIFPQTESAINNGFTLVEIIETEKPQVSNLRTEKVEEISPAMQDGIWQTQWQIISKSSEEIAADQELVMRNVRDLRNKLLANSDWTQLSDSPVDKNAWATYRQSLRDIPAQSEFPWDVVWPITP